jgi:hypothetical protein
MEDNNVEYQRTGLLCSFHKGDSSKTGSALRYDQGPGEPKNPRKGLISQTACDNVLTPKTSKVDSPSPEAVCVAKAGLLLAPREYAGGYNP